MLSSGHWNCKIRPNARVILLCCLVIVPSYQIQRCTAPNGAWSYQNTTVYSRIPAIHFWRKRFMAVIAWTLSWLGSRVSIMAPLLCRQILSGMLGFCSCSQHLLRLTLDPSPSNAHSCRCWKHTTILRMVMTISIISLIFVMCIMLIEPIKTSQVGWNLSVPCRIWARLQETNSLGHSYWNYPGKTAGSSRRRQRNRSPPPAQSLSGSARRLPAGFLGRMQDVICQLVGIGMVQRYVMKANSVESTVRHGVRHREVVLLYHWFQLEWNDRK